MLECTYQYLFPFEKIRSGSRVLIYGAGVVGSNYLQQILTTNYCKVVGMIDKAADKFAAYAVPVYLPSKICDLKFDYIIIALATKTHYPQVMAMIQKYSVEDSKIIYIGERKVEQLVPEFRYQYLFPFEKVPPGSQILIYGADEIIRNYMHQLITTEYCDIVGIIDDDANKCKDYTVPVYLPSRIDNLKFDYIIVAIASSKHYSHIFAKLERYGIDENKIIYVGVRKCLPLKNSICFAAKRNDVSFSFEQKNNISIAIRLGGGLGDFIVYKKHLLALATLSSRIQMDLFAALEFPDRDFIRQIYRDIPGIANIFFKYESRYESQYRNLKEDYMLALVLTHMISFECFDVRRTADIDCDFTAKMVKLQQATEVFGFKDASLSNQVVYEAHAKYRKQNIYTAAYFSDVLGIHDTAVTIPLQKNDVKKPIVLEGKRYITINCSNGRGGQEVTKQWPYQHYCEFVSRFKRKYPEVGIVQLGSTSSEKIPDCTAYILGEEMNTVAYLLKGALFHLDIEGGLVHLATQLGTKCVVLFGPTSKQFYGYEQNINIVSQTCKECFGLTPGGFQCVRKLREPECMYSILPSVVMEEIENYLTGIGI